MISNEIITRFNYLISIYQKFDTYIFFRNTFLNLKNDISEARYRIYNNKFI